MSAELNVSKKQFQKNSISLWSRAAFATICAALALMLLCALWATLTDVRHAREQVMRNAIQAMRSRAMRRVGHLETNLEDVYGEKEVDWVAVREDPWVQQYWEGVTPLQEHQVYAAIVSDPDGMVILHSQPELEDGQLARRWYDRSIAQYGDDVVEASDNDLAEQRVIDVRLPIVVHGREVAAYHEGMDAEWLEKEMDRARWLVISKWALVMAVMALALLLAVVALTYIVARKAALARAVREAERKHVMEIEMLAAGLAHEVRNPLHALRLNLHALGRALNGKAKLSDKDLASMIAESNREIDRVARLMQELLGFAKPEAAHNATFSLGSAAQATVNFLREEMRRKQIEVETRLPDSAVFVRMDQGRLRQILINLLGNASDAAGEGGRVSVTVGRRAGRAEVVVADNGPGIEEEDRDKIFEPFFSTKGNGSGFGLALVRKFVEDAGGSIRCEANNTRGALFRVRLPLAAGGSRRQPSPAREPS
jgi:signal transduction histidine kinase